MRLKVEPDVIALAPGDVTDLLVRVHNDGAETCTPHLQVRGVDPDDVLLPDEVVAVPAGSVMTAVVRVRAAVDAVPGDQRIAVAAQDLDGMQSTVSTTTVLRIGARPDVAVEVDPVATAGRRGAKARTVLRNRSDRRLQVDLEGRGEGVRVAFRPSRVTLDPGETKRVPTRLRRARRSWFGEIRHGAVITARGIGVPASTTATFTQKPSVPRPAVRGVAALTALAVWVAATVVVFNRINAEPEAGPDSAVVAAPAAPGPGRTSATGMFEEDVEEGVRLPVVIQGTIEGPRDPSGTTVTAERIGFGDRGTTTGLTKVVALAEVKIPRGNVLDVVRTTTDERGRFRIASGLVEDAFYRVTAVRAGFEVGSFIVSTSADEPEVTLAVALEPATGALAGSVEDTDGVPIGGATVVVTDGSVEYTTVTPSDGDDAGRWALEGLATPATYQVLVSRRGFAAQTLIVELEGGRSLEGIDAVLTADLGTIVGRITDANPDPNQPGVAQGVGALTVTVAGPEARETRTLTVAGDLRGTFDLPGLPYGDYTITFAGDGWETRQAEVTVDRGLVRLDATVNRSTGLVQGYAWQVATGADAFQGACRYPRNNQRDGAEATAAGTRARPCGGVSVTVESDEGDVFATATATDSGFFQIGGVPAGEYTLTLSRPGYVSDVRSIRVQPGGTFDLNPEREPFSTVEAALAGAVDGRDFITLGLAAPPAACAGSVLLTLIDFRDGTGIDPVTDASAPGVVTVSNSSECDPAVTVSRVGTSGSYLLQNVPLGPQTITVEGDADVWAYESVAINVQVSPLDRVAVTQNILPRPRTLTLPAGTIRMDGPSGASRDVTLEVINASGTPVGEIGGTTITLSGGSTNAEFDLDIVGPDRDLRIRAVSGSAAGYETVTSASFELPAGAEPFVLPLLGPDEDESRLTVVATTVVSGTIFGFFASPLALVPLEGATITFPAGSRPGDNATALSVVTGSSGAFEATVRAGTYLQGVTADRDAGTFGAITVSALGYETRLFNLSGTPLDLTGNTSVLRDVGTSFFLLYGDPDRDAGDVGLDPSTRDGSVSIELTAGDGVSVSRSVTVRLTGGEIDGRPTRVPDGTSDGAEQRDFDATPGSGAAGGTLETGTPGTFDFTDVPAGDYTLEISGDHVHDVTIDVTIGPDTGDFTLDAQSIVATTTVTGTIFEFDDLDSAFNIVPADTGTEVVFPTGSDPTDPGSAITVNVGSDGAFTAVVRSADYGADGLGEVVVEPADSRHQSRSFGLVLDDEVMALRQPGVAAFLLNPGLTGTGSDDGDIVLNPTTRSVNVDVTLLGADDATREMTVTLTDGTMGDATTPVDATPGVAAHPAEVAVGTPGTFGFMDVRPGTYTLTISGDHIRDIETEVFIELGTGSRTVSREVKATVDVTVTVSETLVLGSTSNPGSPVNGATVSATASSASDDSDDTDASGEAVLTLDSGITYDLSVSKAGYATASGLTVGVGSATTQTKTVTLPDDGKLRVFGEVSDRVQSVRVLDGTTQVGIVAGLGTGTKSYSVDGLPTDTLLQVDFHASTDGTGTPLVSRWIQIAAADNVSIQLDQDAEPGDIGTITVDVEVPVAPAGVTTPGTVTVRLIEIVPADFYSISETGVITAESAACTDTPRTCRVTFTGLAKESSSTSLPEKRFTVAIDSTGGSSLIPEDYVVSSAGSFTSVEVGDTKTFVLRTRPGAPAAPTLTVVPQSGTSSQQIDVSWSAPPNTGGAPAGELTYIVSYRAGSSSEFDELSPTSAGVTTASITGLSAGTTYEVRVRAVSTVGDVALVGADSPVAEATTANVPTAPGNITASPTGDGGVTVTWDPSDPRGAPLAGYTISADPADVGPESVGGNVTTVTFGSGFAAGETYTFEVVASNAVGDSAAASSDSVTPTPVADIDPADPASFAAFGVAGDPTLTTIPTTDGGAEGGVYFDLEDNEVALDLGTGLLSEDTSYTLIAWVWDDGGGPNRNILSTRDEPFWVAGSTLGARVGGSTLVTSSVFPTGVWKHVAFTFEDGGGSPAGTARLFIDGVQVDIEEDVGERFTGGQAYLGAYVNIDSSPYNFWNGRIGLVQVWAVALNPAAIGDHYESTKDRYIP